jgi:hypothetical protein
MKATILHRKVNLFRVNMKTAWLRSTIISFVALAVGLSFAGERARPKKIVAPAHPQAQSHSNHLVKIKPASGAKEAANIPSKYLPMDRFDQTEVYRAAAIEKNNLAMTRGGNHRQELGWSPVDDRTTSISPGVRRQRTITTVSIGGAATRNDRHSAAVIDGAEMQRKR